MSSGQVYDADGVMPFFVYGTLLAADDGDRVWLQYVNRIEQNLIVTGYSLWTTHGAFPYAMESIDDSEYVFGDLLWPANDLEAGRMTRALDSMEGHPSWYVRTAVTVMRNRHSTQEAWMYVMPTAHMYAPGACKAIGSSWMTYKRNNPTKTKIQAWRGSVLL